MVCAAVYWRVGRGRTAQRPCRGREWAAVAAALGALALAVSVARAVPAGQQPLVAGVAWPDRSLPVVVDLGELPAEWRPAAEAALAAWNGAGARLWYVMADGPAPPNAVRLRLASPLHVCGGQWQPAACTYPFVYQFAPQHLSRVEVLIAPERLRPERQQWPRQLVTLEALLVHELGHAAGLGPADDPGSALHPAAQQLAPSAADRDALRALYGEATGPRALTPPRPLAPAPDATAAAPVVLRWEPLPAAFGYYVQLVDEALYALQGGIVDVDFGYYLVDASTTETELPVPPLPPGAYRWRVKARTPAGNSPWTPPIAFRVEAMP